MRSRCFTNIEALSVSYGRWSRANPNISYPSMQPFLREATYADRYPSMPLSDEMGMLIHDKLLIMRKVSPLLFEVFMRKYVSKQEVKRILLDLDIGETYYRTYLYAAKQSLLLMLSESKCIFLA
ncbi:RNA polymerase subunit sigma-70 [Pasteurella caecimuris]|uniref:RNA polymerase subunit sigma-70 n=1 Tax=Rodentibacter caecimuris TaxID=1796644 RepID=UPI00214FDFE0|nr:RNA polymerase subunit sigma-70 [Pasteurella caecimuris]MCR1838440.1 RNA polymerase subunit sigma-70 [Pasteurella caecimuris]MCU0107732.1 RNA polymerase subunit sigma-70 [Pasteurella caecimuris]